MKVLMFGWEFPPHITGGLGTACYGLVKGLVKHGVEVIFVIPKAFGDEQKESFRLIDASDVTLDFKKQVNQEYWKNIQFMEIAPNLIPYAGTEEFERIISENLKLAGVDTTSIFSKRFVFSGKYGHDLMKEVSRYALVASTIAAKTPLDVIHSHDWLTYPAGIAAKAISGKPLVIHVHATEFDRSGENMNPNVYDIERKGMEAADRIITVSRLTRHIVIDRYGINPDKIHVVHNAVEPKDGEEMQPAERYVDEKIVTFLGRITFQKGPDYFVEAAARVIHRDKNVRFVMAGSGDMMNKMIKRVAQLKIASHFHFTGFLKGAEVDRMFAMSDVYVMPSVSEPFGISPLEAMRSNVPVVISKQSGVAEVLRHALKVDFWDIDALADSINGLIKYPALRNIFVRLGKEEVDSLKWENSALLVIETYKNALGIAHSN